MINIYIPNNNIEERKYIINTIFQFFLGLEINIEIKPVSNYLIILGNKKKIEIKDSFFNKYKKDFEYLNLENIPKDIQIIKNNKFIDIKNLPIIYGEPNISDSLDQIICGIDIFASSFFMLTRWEENVIKDKDKHNRFPDHASLAFKNKFHKRPIVNEYVELLWNMIYHLDDSLDRKDRQYSVTVTHDVDKFRRYDSFIKYIKALGGDLLLRKNPLLWFKTSLDFVSVQLKIKKDPYDSFEYLMKVSENNNIKSHFYFMPNKMGELDARYNIENISVRKTIETIIKKGHFVGIHGSYQGYNNGDVFKYELKRFNEFSVIEGRQHYLRFENPKTWQMWEDNNFESDSTMGYSEFSGFRSGICYEYPVFNILTRTSLKLIEKPLIAMERAIRNEYNDIELFINDIKMLSSITKIFNGNFVFLWHSNNINTNDWKSFSTEYEKIISSILID